MKAKDFYKRRVRSLVKTAQDVGKTILNDGGLRASSSLQDKRLKTCLACNRFDGVVCNACTCRVKFKVALQASTCPIGLW